MMQEVIENIVNRISFEKKDLFKDLLSKCIENLVTTEDDMVLNKERVIFRTQLFFQGFSPFINAHGKDRKYESGVEALSIICDELGIEITKSDCFLLFHIKDLGKFKMKETKLHDELKSLWGKYKEYKLSDQDFSYTLKSLMRTRFIEYRKGNLSLNKTINIFYRKEIY